MWIFLHAAKFQWLFHFHLFSDIDECATLPCQNEGICNNGQNEYTCTCINGWQGTNCNTGRNIHHISCVMFWWNVDKGGEFDV